MKKKCRNYEECFFSMAFYVTRIIAKYCVGDNSTQIPFIQLWVAFFQTKHARVSKLNEHESNEKTISDTVTKKRTVKCSLF